MGFFPVGRYNMVFLYGEHLPYGIISGRGGGQSAMIFALIIKCVCVCVWEGGGGYHRGGSFTIWYCFPLGKFGHGISTGERFAIWYSLRGNVYHMVLFPGGGGVRGKNSHVTPTTFEQRFYNIRISQGA